LAGKFAGEEFAMVSQHLAPWPNLSIFGNVKLGLAGNKLLLGGRLGSRVLGATIGNNRLLTAVVACRRLKGEHLIPLRTGGRVMRRFLLARVRSFCSLTAWALLAGAGGLPQQACAQAREAATGQQVGMVTPGPSIKLGLEAGGGWAHNNFEESNDFTGRGFIGGASAEFNYPIGAIAYIGLSASVLGSGITGTIADPITSYIRLLVPIDSTIGLTFGDISIYGFGGLAIGDVKISVPPLSATQAMAGWSVGIGADVQLTRALSAGVKYRHFDLAKQDFSIFPDAPSLVRERGDTITGTLSWRIPMSR
jgi:outer membrane immunogenic protein